jgi:predicted MFS family arabinose efflux permease
MGHGGWLLLVPCYMPGGLFLMASFVTETGVFIGQILVGLGLGSAGISIAIGAVARAAPPEKRSLAMGLVTSFGSFGQFALVPITQILMVNGGWQFALVMLSAIMASMVAVAIGLRTPAGSARPVEGPVLTIGATLHQAVNSRDYILLTIGFFVCGLQLVFITTHLPTYLHDAGLSTEISSWALALIGLFNIIGAFVCGWLGGIVSKKKTLATVYLLRGIIVAAFIVIPPTSGNGTSVWRGYGAVVARHDSIDQRPDYGVLWPTLSQHAVRHGVFVASDRVVCWRLAWRHLV